MTPRASDDPAPEDLTARARIREAAIRLFAERGVEETAILDIAKDAGVSGGLIRHHFGSKEGLRVACDSYVLSELVRFKLEAIEKGEADPKFLVTFDARQVLLRRYFGRAMIDGSPAAASRFDDIVDEFEQWLIDQPGLDVADARACAAVMTAMDIGVHAMQDHIARALGEDPRTPKLQERITLAYGDIYSPALLPGHYHDEKGLNHD
ncbi:MAG: helix-turn-helix domain-containing protein [Dermatophilaceae bacterium]